MMEPDEIKKMWQEVDLLKEKQQISDQKIKKMLKNQGKTALAKLIRTANFYRFAIIPLGLFFCLLSYKFFEAGGYYLICPLAFLLVSLLMEWLEIYLYRLLKGIDFAIMPVKEVSERILKYQHIIQQTQLYGTMGFMFFTGIWLFLYYTLMFGTEIIWGFIIYMVALYLTGLIVLPILFKKLYYNNINQIKESLKELKEFEVC